MPKLLLAGGIFIWNFRIEGNLASIKFGEVLSIGIGEV